MVFRVQAEATLGQSDLSEPCAHITRAVPGRIWSAEPEASALRPAALVLLTSLLSLLLMAALGQTSVLAMRSPDSSAALTASQSSGTVVVNLNPSLSNVARGQIFTVDLQLVAGSQQVDGAEVHLFFDPSYLQVVDAAGNPTDRITSSGYLSQILRNRVYTDTGRIHFAAGIYDPEEPKPSGTFPVATVRFKALWGTAGLTTPLTFGNALPFKTEVTYGGVSVLGGVEDGAVVISGEQPAATWTVTPSATLSATPTSTATATHTSTPVDTATPTATPTTTDTPSPTATPTPTATRQCVPITIWLQQGILPDASYTGVADTFLSIDEATVTHGGSISLQMKNDANGGKRPLLRFDVSRIPVGSLVTAATLHLAQDPYRKNDTFSSSVGVYAAHRNWNAAEATWYKATALDSWASAGGDGATDRSYVAETSLDIGVIPEWQWRLFPVREIVQYWVNNPAENRGVFLIGSGFSQEFRFYSSEYPVAAQRPKLEVAYCLPPPTATPTLTPTPTSTPTVTPTPTATPLPGTILGMVWNDLLGDGIMEPDAVGLAGATLYLYDSAHPEPGPPARPPLITGADGLFAFASLAPGWYTLLRENPMGYTSTTGDRFDVLVTSSASVRVNLGAWIPPTHTPTATSTLLPTATPTCTPTATVTASPTPTATVTLSPTPTATVTRSPTPTATNSPTLSPTPTETNTTEVSPTPSVTRGHYLLLPLILRAFQR